jgi:hypothetical protein
VTRYLLDVAVYQGALKPADVARAGFTAVNLKTSHGLGTKNVHPDLTGWVTQARTLGLGISTFHYFTPDAPGADQARHAYARLAALGLTAGTAHQVDVESTPAPTLAEVRAYLTTMTGLLQRPIAFYTGDWWWADRALWGVADLTPYLWSAPNAGYLDAYPGDASAHWRAGYGGWPDLSVMQYAVAPLSFPDGSRGSIDVSKSAIRDPAVWAALTGETAMTFAPASCLAVRRVFQDHTTLSDAALGVVGDDNHAQNASSYHLGKSANKPNSYTITESSRDKNGLSEAASANDIGYFSISVGGKKYDLRHMSMWLVEQCKAGAADTKDIREVIYSPDGKSVKRWDALGIRSTGDDSHLSHTHVSWFRDSENRDRAAVFRRYFTEIQGEDMAITDTDAVKIFNTDTAVPVRPWMGDAGTNPSLAAATMLARTADEAHAANVAATAALSQIKLNQAALLAAVTNADDGAAVVAAVQAEAAKIRQDIAAGEAQDVATAAAIGAAVTELRALRSLLDQAGGDPDIAPVLLRLDRLGELVQTSGREAGAEAAKSVIARLLAAQEAEAAALRGEG